MGLVDAVWGVRLVMQIDTVAVYVLCAGDGEKQQRGEKRDDLFHGNSHLKSSGKGTTIIFIFVPIQCRLFFFVK